MQLYFFLIRAPTVLAADHLALFAAVQSADGLTVSIAFQAVLVIVII